MAKLPAPSRHFGNRMLSFEGKIERLRNERKDEYLLLNNK